MELTVKEQLKIIMKRKGINQTHIANRLGLTRATVSKFFRSEEYRSKELEKYAKAIGCEVEVTIKEI